MPSFQDFGPVWERRKAELNRKRKRNFIIFGSIAFILILSVSTAAAVVVQNLRQKRSSDPVTSVDSPASSDALPSMTSIKTVCSKTGSMCVNLKFSFSTV